MIQRNLSTKKKQTHRHREQTCGSQAGDAVGRRHRLGVCNQQIQTITYKVDKQQGPTVEYMELHSLSCDKP